MQYSGFGLGNPLKEEAADIVYAPISSNSNQSPISSSGNRVVSNTLSRPSHVGPQILPGTRTAALE